MTSTYTLCFVLLVFCGGTTHGSSRPLKFDNDTKELHESQGDPVNYAEDWSTQQCSCLHGFIVGLGGGLTGGGVLIIFVVIVWKCKKSTILSYIFSEKRKYLTEKEDRLRKQSQTTQEELEAWGAVLTPLKEQKTGLENQRKEFRLQLEEIEKEREENREKVLTVEREIAESEREKATDRTEGYLREKQSLLKAQWKLEKRKEDVEKQQLNTEKLLQKTDGMMGKIAERKSKVQNHLQLIHMSLEEVGDHDDRTHLHRE